MTTPEIRRAAYSVPEVVAATGLGRDRIYDAINNGTLIAKKFGRRTLVLESDLHRFLQGLPQKEARSS